MSKVTPKLNPSPGTVIKLFQKEFAQELRARNRVNHHERFEDVAIDRVFLTEALSTSDGFKGWEREHRTVYRKLAKEWADRVRKRGARLDEYFEFIADVTLANCEFLSSALAKK